MTDAQQGSDALQWENRRFPPSEEFKRQALVVDTGLHAKHWSRQQVVDFFHAHSTSDEVEVQSETDRYIECPGQALAYMMTPESVDRLFNTVAPRYGSRPGGYSRIVRTGQRQGDAAEMAYIELLGAEAELSEKAEKREAARTKKREELQKQLDERGPGEDSDPSATA